MPPKQPIMMTDQPARTNRGAEVPRAGELHIGLSMSLRQAERLSARLLAERGASSVAPLRDLLWLRAVLIEQWRRTPAAERERFTKRADRILHGLGGPVSLSGSGHTVERHDKP
jgi:hypothetical protein